MSYYNDYTDPREEDLKFTRNEKLGMLGFFVGLILLIVIIYAAVTHREKGTIMFGVCKAYVEMTLTYPPTMKVSEVIQYPRAVRIFYNYTDPYGNMKSEFVECAFTNIAGKGAQATSILHNRKEVSEERIKEFNKSISAIVNGEPDLILPRRLGANLQDLKE